LAVLLYINAAMPTLKAPNRRVYDGQKYAEQLK
jgi:hypothetical protein